MAVVIQTIYGNQGSENAFQGIAGMLVYFTQYLLMFLYNYRVFQLLSVDELKAVIQQAIEETGAQTAADMGKVMKAVMPKVKGLAANDLISKTVKEMLS